MPQRFTIDGSDALEVRLQETCARVREAICAMVPESRLEALVLGGGYGRGQGGVLREGAVDLPYNDLEFYVFTRGNRILNARRYTEPLRHLGEYLSQDAQLHVEFKVDTIDRLRHAPVSMFSYDLVTAHRIILGPVDTFAACGHHLDARSIPIAEATRLLFNRCTGLLLAKEMLIDQRPDPEASDFIARNIAKAQLALGDAVLAAERQYHWSCLEREQRLGRLSLTNELARKVLAHHRSGVTFKLHPTRSRDSFDTLAELHGEVAAIAREVWFSLEGRRLDRSFDSPEAYAACKKVKCNGTPCWWNYLLNLRTFGWKAVMDPTAARYPRERLLNALPLLLWDTAEGCRNNGVHRMLHARSAEWGSLVAAYKEVWPAYG